jgi:hypothetical protein
MIYVYSENQANKHIICTLVGDILFLLVLSGAHLQTNIYSLHSPVYICERNVLFIVKPHNIMIHQGSLSYAMKRTFSILSPCYT